MKRLALLAGVAMVLGLGVRPACAQGVFADVPTNHWAYDAVNELAAKGIFTGYPDQTFGGKRALTRYEFAVAIQRMLQDIQRQIDALKNAPQPPQPPAAQPGVSREEFDRLKAEVDRQRAEQERLRGAVDTLQRLMREFQDTLAALGADVDQLKRDVAALAERLGRVEEAIAKMPKITGTASVAFIGRKLRHPDRFVGGPEPTDIDNRPLGLDKSLLESVDGIYDIDLGITARLSDVATAHVLLNAGNYLKGYLNNSISTVREVNSAQKSFDQVTAYYLYLDTPISFGGFGADITVGKFGQQFTPYTLKLIDVDSYTYNDKTDSGNYPILGGRVNFKLGGVNVQYYAGKHEEIDYADLSSTAGIAQPPLFTLRGPIFNGNPALPAPSVEQAIDQSQGARISFGVPLRGTLGLTWIDAKGNDPANVGAIYRRLNVYGADLNATPFGKLRISAEFAQSRWVNNAGVNAGPSVRDRQIIDARAGFRFGRLDILGFYKRLGVGFDAPGYWGTIGRWKNPRDLEGFGGILTLPLGGRTSIDLEGAKYRSLSGAFDLRHYRAGFRFALTSANRVDLGYERAEYEPNPSGDKAAENYINIGWGHNFSPTTSFKLLYQIINFSVGDTGLNPLQSFNGAVAATQFTVRF